MQASILDLEKLISKEDRKAILRKENKKKEKKKLVEGQKTEEEELLREMMVNVGLERIDT